MTTMSLGVLLSSVLDSILVQGISGSIDGWWLLIWLLLEVPIAQRNQKEL